MSAEFALVESKDCAALFADEQSAESRAHVAANEIELAVYHELAAAEPVWRSLQKDGACTAFQTFEWLSMWQRHIGTRTGAMPCIVVARDANGAPLFIVPLAVCRSGFTRELTWLGSDLCDYNAPIFAKDALERLDHAEFAVVWQNIVELLRREPRCRYDLARLEKMPPSIGTHRNPMLALPTSLNPSGSYVTPLFGTWDEFYKAKRSSETRKKERKQLRRLGELGDVRFVAVGDKPEIARTIETLMQQKSKAFARMGVEDLFARPGYRAFWLDVASALHGIVHVSRLDVGPTVAATSLGLTHRGCYYLVLSSYHDGEVMRFGPGRAHLHELLRHAIEHGIRDFDFTIGDEPYKRDWADIEVRLHDHLQAATPRGAVVVAMISAFRRTKRLIKTTPALWRTYSKAREIAWFLRLR